MRLFKGTFIDKRLIQFILIIYFLAYVIDFLSVLLTRYFSINDIEQAPLDFFNLLSKYILTYSLKLLFLFFAVYITTHLITKKSAFIKSILIHTFLAFSLSFYTAHIGLLLSKYVFKEDYSISLASVWIRGLSALSFNFFVYLAIISIVYAYYYLQKQKEVAIKQEQLKTQLLDAKINALQSQLQPHFLFNAMNDISSLMDIDIEKSQNAIADLSSLLRSTLQIKDAKYISLQQELAILQHYLDIEKIRFGDKVHFTTEISPTLYSLKVPPLLLQPFIENAIKHGFSYEHDVLNIALQIYKENNQLIFNIQNDGSPLKNEHGINFGNGISNVLERLETLYSNSHYHFEMKNIQTSSAKPAYVQVMIVLPQKTL